MQLNSSVGYIDAPKMQTVASYSGVNLISEVWEVACEGSAGSAIGWGVGWVLLVAKDTRRPAELLLLLKSYLKQNYSRRIIT